MPSRRPDPAAAEAARQAQVRARDPAPSGPAGARFRTPRPPNVTAPSPPQPTPAPGPGAFTPLDPAATTRREDRGLSPDAGPMMDELEQVIYPAPSSGGTCTNAPTTDPALMALRINVATMLSVRLMTDVPSLSPTDSPDPMGTTQAAAEEAMPTIHSHYAPYAPSRTPASFMSGVSVKPATYADSFRSNDHDLGEFLEWYAGQDDTIRPIINPYCDLDRAWWNGFATWVRASGFNSTPIELVERARIYDTWNTTVAGGGQVEIGRAFDKTEMPGTVCHEAMHLFAHPDFNAGVAGLAQRHNKDVFSEGFAEYLARGVLDLVVDRMVARAPPALTPGEATAARRTGAYQFYVDQAVALRDTLYRHGQDGEDAIQRAFFLGEVWRFGVAAGDPRPSPVESDRPVPGRVDVHFDNGKTDIKDEHLLLPLLEYLRGRSIATVHIVGRASTSGSLGDNDILGDQRAGAVRAWFEARGVDAGRITTATRGERDQISGGAAANRRATVEVRDSRNSFPSRQTSSPSP